MLKIGMACVAAAGGAVALAFFKLDCSSSCWRCTDRSEARPRDSEGIKLK